MATAQFRFEGGEALAATLAGLPKGVSKTICFEALEAGADPMVRAMRGRAPRSSVAPHVADHIGVSRNRAGVDAFGDPLAYSVSVGPFKGFFYARFPEYGTIHMSAQPFMRPGFDSGAAKAVEILIARLWTGLASVGIGRSATSAGPSLGGPGGGTL